MGGDHRGKKRQGGGGGRGGGRGSKRHRFAQHGPSSGNQSTIPRNSRGFLITCESGRESRAGTEAVALLSEQYERMTASSGDVEAQARPSSGGAVDIAAAIAEEIEELRDKEGKMFWYMMTGLKGLIFVRMGPSEVSPSDLCYALAKRIEKEQQMSGKMILRVMPVETTCFASVEEIKEAAAPIIAREFPKGDQGISLAVEYNLRSGPKLERMEVIDAIVDQVPRPPHTVSLNTAQKSIIVSIIKNAACLAVLPEYHALKRMNLARLAGLETPEEVRASARRKAQAEKEGEGAEGKTQGEEVKAEEGKGGDGGDKQAEKKAEEKGEEGKKENGGEGEEGKKENGEEGETA